MMIGSYYIFFWGKEREGGGGINNMIIKVLLLLIYAKVPFWPSGQFSKFFSWSYEEKSSLWLLHFSAVHKIQFKHSRRKKVSVTKEKGKQINDVSALSRPSSKIFSSRISIYLNLWHESKLQKNSIHFFLLTTTHTELWQIRVKEKVVAYVKMKSPIFYPRLAAPLEEAINEREV